MVIHTKGNPQTGLQLSCKIIKIDSCEVPKIMKEAMYAACLGEICKRSYKEIWREKTQQTFLIHRLVEAHQPDLSPYH
jgi:hypothetical protein